MPRDRRLMSTKSVRGCLEAFVFGGETLAVEDASTGKALVSGSHDAAEVLEAMIRTAEVVLILRPRGSSVLTRYGFKSVRDGLLILSSERRTYH